MAVLDGILAFAKGDVAFRDVLEWKREGRRGRGREDRKATSVIFVRDDPTVLGFFAHSLTIRRCKYVQNVLNLFPILACR